MRVSLHLASSNAARPVTQDVAQGVTQSTRGRAAATASQAASTTDATDDKPAKVDHGDDSKSDFRSLMNKYRSSSSSDDQDDDDSDSNGADAQDQPKKQDSTRVLTLPLHVVQPMHEVLPLIAQNPFLKMPDVEPSLYTSDAQTELPEETSEASSDAAPQIEEKPRPAPPPTVDASDAPPSSSAPVAFAAKLTPPDDAPESAPRAQANSNAPPQPKQTTTPAAIAPDSDSDPAPAKTDVMPAIEKIVKLDTPDPSPAQPEVSASTPKNAPAQNVTAASRMEPLIEAPVAPPAPNHDFTVRIPDASERAIDVRFVDRGGEIHVSVRSADAETAQSLRGGLNDFVSRMDHAGIRTEVWRPGADTFQQPQNDSQNQSSDPRDQKRQSSQSEDRDDRDSQNSRKPKWVEALEKASSQSV